MTFISNLASIATLCLFIIYFIGRIWTLFKETHYGLEKLHIVASEQRDEHLDDLDFGGDVTVEIVSASSYKYFSVSLVEYNDFESLSIKRKKETKCLKNIPINKPIYVIVDFPGVIPYYYVEFQRYDGMKGSYFLQTSGKTGEVFPDDYKLKHTGWSIMYYLFR